MFTFLPVAIFTLCIAATVSLIASAHRRAMKARPSASVSSAQRFVWRIVAVCLPRWQDWRAQLCVILVAWTLTHRRVLDSILALVSHHHTPHRAYPLSCCLLD